MKSLVPMPFIDHMMSILDLKVFLLRHVPQYHNRNTIRVTKNGSGLARKIGTIKLARQVTTAHLGQP